MTDTSNTALRTVAETMFARAKREKDQFKKDQFKRDREKAGQVLAEKTARLRALRLAKEASDLEEAAQLPIVKPIKKRVSA